jgi:hypothetical protein
MRLRSVGRTKLERHQRESGQLRNNDDGGEAILEAFRNLNIEYVFSSPGSESDGVA